LIHIYTSEMNRFSNIPHTNPVQFTINGMSPQEIQDMNNTGMILIMDHNGRPSRAARRVRYEQYVDGNGQPMATPVFQWTTLPHYNHNRQQHQQQIQQQMQNINIGGRPQYPQYGAQYPHGGGQSFQQVPGGYQQVPQQVPGVYQQRQHPPGQPYMPPQPVVAVGGANFEKRDVKTFLGTSVTIKNAPTVTTNEDMAQLEGANSAQLLNILQNSNFGTLVANFARKQPTASIIQISDGQVSAFFGVAFDRTGSAYNFASRRITDNSLCRQQVGRRGVLGVRLDGTTVARDELQLQMDDPNGRVVQRRALFVVHGGYLMYFENPQTSRVLLENDVLVFDDSRSVVLFRRVFDTKRDDSSELFMKLDYIRADRPAKNDPNQTWNVDGMAIYQAVVQRDTVQDGTFVVTGEGNNVLDMTAIQGMSSKAPDFAEANYMDDQTGEDGSVDQPAPDSGGAVRPESPRPPQSPPRPRTPPQPERRKPLDYTTMQLPPFGPQVGDNQSQRSQSPGADTGFPPLSPPPGPTSTSSATSRLPTGAGVSSSPSTSGPQSSTPKTKEEKNKEKNAKKRAAEKRKKAEQKALMAQKGQKGQK
jgi:hypothetical protein